LEKIVAGRLAVVLCLFLAFGCASASKQQTAQADYPEEIVLAQGAVGSTVTDAVVVAQNDDPFGDYVPEEDDEHLDDDVSAPVVSDPLEGFNRAMFRFNDRLYFWLLKPAAQGYSYVVPEKMRTGVDNFFHNLKFPIRFVNNILQGKFHHAALEFDRFWLNTVAGAGFFNPASRHDELNIPEEDFGQTLGHYGMGDGFYIVWPVFGPSTARDTVGFGGDYFLDPVTYVEPWESSLGIAAYRKFNRVSLTIGDYETLIESAIDPYSAVKDAYIQYRTNQIEK